MSTAAAEQLPKEQVLEDIVIWPRSLNMTAQEASKTEAAIRAIIGTEEPLKNYTSRTNGVMWWSAYMTATQAKEVEKLDGVGGTQVGGEDPDTGPG